MKEFVLLIRTEGDHLAEMSAEEQQKHVQKIGKYINNLMQEGKLKGAQPLDMDGKMIHGKEGVFKDGPFNESKEVIAGYFLVTANDIDEAVAIAKGNPIFKDIPSKIEVHPMMPVGGN